LVVMPCNLVSCSEDGSNRLLQSDDNSLHGVISSYPYYINFVFSRLVSLKQAPCFYCNFCVYILWPRRSIVKQCAAASIKANTSKTVTRRTKQEWTNIQKKIIIRTRPWLQHVAITTEKRNSNFLNHTTCTLDNGQSERNL
jgi:hypothetical protein